jgi:predicted lipoprotein with Yx(FWY)xxD motif
VTTCGWRHIWTAALLAGAGLLAAACGSPGPPATTSRPSATAPGSSATASRPSATTSGSSATASRPSATAPGVLSAPEGGNAVTLLKTAATKAGTVLTNGTGFTLYWFTRDTATSSACNNVCLSNWQPVTGRLEPVGDLSLPGKLSTFVRSDGATQATYNGHPLYTFGGDFEPGSTEGNGLYEFGGVWFALTIGPS